MFLFWLIILGKIRFEILNSVLKYEVYSEPSTCHVKDHLRWWLSRDIGVTDVSPGKEVRES